MDQHVRLALCTLALALVAGCTVEAPPSSTSASADLAEGLVGDDGGAADGATGAETTAEDGGDAAPLNDAAPDSDSAFPSEVAPGTDAGTATDADAAPQDIQVDPATAKAEFGPAGGSLELPSGAQLVIPPGALAATVQISMAALPPPTGQVLGGSKPVGPALLLEPEGQQFLVPVQLRVPLDKAIAGNVDWFGAKLFIAPKGSEAFIQLDSTVEQNGQGSFAVGQTTHFSWVAPALPPAGAVFITTAALPSGTVGVGYGPVQLAASGGQPPYSWSVPAGGLPPGIEVPVGGAVAGLPSAAGPFAFAIRCTDSAGKVVEKAFGVTMAPAKPDVSWVQPPTVPQFSGETAITVTGKNFVQGSTVCWQNDSFSLATTYVSADKLTATIDAAKLKLSGSFPIYVKNPDGAKSTASYSFKVSYVASNPVPKITKLAPASVVSGSADSQITVTGSGFVAASLVSVGGQGISTQFVSASELHAVVPAAYLASPGSVELKVYNPEPGGGYGAPATLAVTGPSGAEIGPDAGTFDAGSLDSGPADVSTSDSGVSDAGATDGGSADAGLIDADVDAADAGALADADAATDAAIDAATDSGPLAFKLVGEPVPTWVQQWSGDIVLQISVQGYDSGVQVLLSTTNGPQPLTLVSKGAKLIEALLPKDLFAVAGQLAVTVKNSDGSLLGPIQITVAKNESWGPPTNLALVPSSTSLDAADQVMRVKGSYLPGGTTVHFGNLPLSVTWKSMYELECALPKAAHAQLGPVMVTVTQPQQTGGGQAAVPFVVTAPGLPVPYLVPLQGGAAKGPTVQTSSSDLTLTLEGHNLRAETVVRVDGEPVPTKLGPKGDTVVASLPLAVVGVAGSHTLDAHNPAPGGGASNSLVLTVQMATPVPQIAALDPPEVRSSSVNTWITVKGSGFLPWSTVTVGGKAPLTTTWLSSSEILVLLLGAEVKTVGDRAVVVTQADPLGAPKVSAAAVFKVVAAGNATPTLSSLSPNSTTMGKSYLMVTGTGGGFLAGARVWVDGVPRLTLPGPATSFALPLSYNDLAAAGTLQIAVQNPPPGGGFSWAQSFSIAGTNPKPVLAALAPAMVGVGTPVMPLAVQMTGWVPKTSVQVTLLGKTWSVPCATKTATGCVADMPPQMFATPGSASLKIVNPGVLASSALTLVIAPGLPTPVVTAMSPALIKQGSTGVKLVVNGAGFTAQTKATDSATGTALPVVAWSNSTLSVQVPDGLSGKAGTLQVVIVNPPTGDPPTGGGTTAPKAIVVKPQPSISSIDPQTVKAGTVVKGLKILGQDLNLPGAAKVYFGGETFGQATVASATELHVDVPPVLTAAPGKVQLAVQIEGYSPSNTVYLEVVP